MIKRGSKRAQMSVETIVAIALLVIILIIVVFGLTMGWGTLWDKITGGRLFSNVNVDTVKENCVYACDMHQINDWCNAQRKIVYMKENKKDNIITTCDKWAKGTDIPTELSGLLEGCQYITCPTA